MEPLQLHSIHDGLRTEAARELKFDEPDEPSPNAIKDAALAEMGWVLEEHPLGSPCMNCGCRRRYSAFPDRCLWCEAVQDA